MSELPSRVLRQLDEAYGPVLARFTINTVPEGAAPESIKEQWVGISLPVREQSLARLAFGAVEYFDYLSFNTKRNDDPVTVTGVEAVHALLEAHRIEAGLFWNPYNMGLLNFRGYEGELVSLENSDLDGPRPLDS